MLKKFLRRPGAEPFAEPVPADVPGYHDVIEHPMDLGSVLANLQDGAYSSLGTDSRLHTGFAALSMMVECLQMAPLACQPAG